MIGVSDDTNFNWYVFNGPEMFGKGTGRVQ